MSSAPTGLGMHSSIVSARRGRWEKKKDVENRLPFSASSPFSSAAFV